MIIEEYTTQPIKNQVQQSIFGYACERNKRLDGQNDLEDYHRPDTGRKELRHTCSGVVNTYYLRCFTVSADGMNNLDRVQHEFGNASSSGRSGLPPRPTTVRGIDKPDKREVFHRGAVNDVI